MSSIHLGLNRCRYCQKVPRVMPVILCSSGRLAVAVVVWVATPFQSVGGWGVGDLKVWGVGGFRVRRQEGQEGLG